MNPSQTVFETLAKLPGFDSENAAIEVLNGGLTNRVFLARSGQRECVVRLSTDSTGAIAPDRSCELKVLESASSAGCSPQVLYADSAAGILVTEYIRGAVWQESDFQSDEKIQALADL